METVYIPFSRPTVAAVTMTRGPHFLRSFAASIRQKRIDDSTIRVSYRYNFEAQPRSFSFLIEPVVGWLLHRETSRRLAALKRHLERGWPG
jgi:hypothetical protein